MNEKLMLAVGAAQLAVEQAGTGPPVVFLHAGVADRRMWQPQLTALSDRFTTIAYDRRGFGETVTPDETFSYVGDLVAVLDQLGIGEATLVGSSQGGRIAVDCALAHPQRVGALVLVAPAISGAPPPESVPPEIDALFDELDAAEEADDLPLINALETHLWLDGPTSAEGRVGGALRDLFLDMNGIALQQPDLTRLQQPPSAFERLGEITQPALVICGDLDFPHVQERCAYLAQTIPDAGLAMIPAAAHLPNLEAPETFNALLREVLE